MKLKPQARATYRYLRENGSITDLEALHALGIRRLAARVWELRREFGEDRIRTEWEDHNGSRYARYHYHEPQQGSLFGEVA